MNLKKYEYFRTDLGILYHGDCLEIMPELEPADLVCTDPPYNAGKDYGICKDNLSEEDYRSWIAKIMKSSLLIAKKQVWIAPRYKAEFYLSIMPKAHMVIVRRGARGPYRGGWSDQFEIILIIGKPSRCEVDLWDDIRLKGEGYFFRESTYGHPGYTPKPIMLRCVDLMSETSVIDPFMGTGTTAVACEKLNRRWIGIEISEEYCEMAKQRIINETRQMRISGF